MSHKFFLTWVFRFFRHENIGDQEVYFVDAFQGNRQTAISLRRICKMWQGYSYMFL